MFKLWDCINAIYGWYLPELRLNQMKIGIIGLGVVGSAYKFAFEKQSHKVYTYDKFKKLPTDVNINNMKEVTDCIFICLPTPVNGKKIDMTAFDETIPLLQGYKKPIFIKSTVLPGTNDFYSKKFKLNLISNPEFLTEKNANEDALHPYRVICGVNSRIEKDTLTTIYHLFNEPQIVTPYEAEIIKFASNCFLSMKVSFSNELFDICGKVGADYEAVKEGIISDPRMGKTHWNVTKERGYGGMCFPKDTVIFKKWCKENKFKFDLLDATIKVNNRVRK